MNDRGYRWAAFTHGASYPMHAQLLQAEYAARVHKEQLAVARAAGHTVIDDEVIMEDTLQWARAADAAKARGFYLNEWSQRGHPAMCLVTTPQGTVRCLTWEQAYYFITCQWERWWQCYNPVR